MFKNMTIFNAAVCSALIAIPCLITGFIIHAKLTKYCKTHPDVNAKIKRKIDTFTVIMLLIVSLGGIYLGNLLNTGITFHKAINHGMTPDADTNEYTLSYGDMITYNNHSVKESRITLDDLKDKAIIYVRYDCYDCLRLHDQLSELNDIVFLSSQSELGKNARNTYNICLTDVPQGVYIDNNGNATVVNIIDRSFNGITLNQQQIANLYEMANHQTAS